MAPPATFLRRSRHGTTLYFRRRVPDDVRADVGQSFVSRTLGTADVAEGRRRARELAVATDHWFEELRMAKKARRPVKSIRLNWTISLLPDRRELQFRPDAHDSGQELDRG